MNLRNIVLFLVGVTLAFPVLAEDVDLYVEVDPGERMLRQEAFTVREDGAQREVVLARPAPSTSLVLLIENSARSWDVLNETHRAMRAFLRRAPSVHSYSLVSFGSDARVESTLSAEVLDAAGSYAEMKRTAWSEVDTYDAVSRALHALAEAPAPRAILLIGSGRNDFSHTTYAELLREVEASDVIIHAILTGGSLREDQAPKSGAPWGEMLHRALAERTGGRSFCPNCEAGYGDAMEQALDSLSRLYLVRYERPTTLGSGFVELKVEAFATVEDRRRELPVRVRKGWRIER